jgi:hypothetical protein
VSYGSLTQWQGIYQVDVIYSDKSGFFDAQSMAETVGITFKRGTALYNGGYVSSVTIENHSIDDGWLVIPVSIGYIVHGSS